VGMANVLNEEKKQQVLALGRLGWSLRRIQQATRIRRETASAYLKAAGIAVRPPGRNAMGIWQDLVDTTASPAATRASALRAQAARNAIAGSAW
jgi:hypothetical protein